MNGKALHGHADRNQWTTPRELFDLLNAEFHFTHDAASWPGNELAPAIGANALREPWSGTVFVNPPYAGRELAMWIRKAWEEAQRGATVVVLVPVRTSVAWWHDYALQAQIRFLRGRLKFGAARVNAPFDSAVLVFYPPLVSLAMPAAPATSTAKS